MRLLIILLALSSALASTPTITSLSPNPVDAGGDYYPLTITGTGFQPGAHLSWNAHALSTTYVSSTELKVQVTPDQRATEGNYVVLVTNPDGGGCTASASISPVLLTVTPPAVPAGSPGITITAKGAGFTARVGLVLNTGGQQFGLPTTFVDPATLTATISASALSTAKSATIQVFDPLYNLSSLPVPFDIHDPTAITSASPDTFDAAGAYFVMAVNGTGFASGSSLTWEGQSLGTTFISSTQLQAAITAQTRSLAGTYHLKVINPTGPPSNDFPITVSPVLFALNPTSAAAAGPAVTITAIGAGLTHNSSLLLVKGAQQTALATTYVNATTLTAIVPSTALKLAGAATVQVVDATGPGHSLTQPFAISAAIPSLATISPTSATAGTAAFTLLLTGANFASGATAQWNATPLSTTYVSPTLLTATVPAALIQSAGVATITVSNPGGTVSGALSFTINPPTPVVTNLNPASVSASGVGFNLTVYGANFIAGSTVQWNGAPLGTSFVNAARLVASVPSTLLTEALSAAVGVANPGGTVSNAVTFIINPPQPAITVYSPTSAIAGGAGFTLTITGFNFAANAVLRWNGTPLTTTFLSATQVTGAVTEDAIAVAGQASVTLTNPSGLVTNPAILQIIAPVPAISALAPTTAQAGSLSLALTINGANFLVNSTVLWNGSPLVATRVSAAQLTAPVPGNLLLAPGVATVKVTTPGAKDSNTAAFTIAPAAITTPPPSVAGGAIVNAASGLPAIAPGSLISIYGLNLAAVTASAAALPLPASLNGTSVTINGTPAPLVFVSPLQLNAQVPFETKVGTATLIVQTGTLKSAPVTFDVAATAPGVLTVSNTSHAVAQNIPDQTLNSAVAPAVPGQYVTIYLTGQGAVDPPVPTGAAPRTADAFSIPVAAIEARLGGQPVQIAFAGLAPGFVGLLQLNIVIPEVPSGEQFFDVTIGGIPANRTLLSVAPR